MGLHSPRARDEFAANSPRMKTHLPRHSTERRSTPTTKVKARESQCDSAQMSNPSPRLIESQLQLSFSAATLMLMTALMTVIAGGNALQCRFACTRPRQRTKARGCGQRAANIAGGVAESTLQRDARRPQRLTHHCRASSSFARAILPSGVIQLLALLRLPRRRHVEGSACQVP